jgi:beta-galactosidase
MKSYFLAGLVLVFCYTSVSAQHKTKIGFNEGWKFKLDSIQSYDDASVDDASWRTLNLPHDWSIEGTFDKNAPSGTGGGALPSGVGWYRKTFSIPASQKDKTVYVEFDGVYRNSEVFINGQSLGIRPYGYSSFHYDLTPYLKYGNESNVIAVKVDNSRQPNSRWYSGSGIYRNVWLTTVDKLHMVNWGTYVTTPQISKELAIVVLENKVENQYQESKGLEVKSTIYDAGGKPFTAAVTKLNQVGKSVAGAPVRLIVRNPVLWSLDNPYLYKIVSEVLLNGKVIDSYTTKFGIRYFNFDIEKGFSLNGKHIKLLGVCDHHDLGALGAAINTRALERQLQILKAMGCNSIRTSHNPPAPELLELCDKMGFVVMDEAFDMWAKAKTKYDYSLNWSEWHEKDLRDFITRDRNHPSVMIWSIGNEILEQWGDEKKGDTAGRNIARELAHIVRSLDTTRPITTANNEVNKWNNIISSGALDLIGYNYSHQRWGNFLSDYPGQKLVITESTSALETRGHYDLVPFDTIRRWPRRWDEALKEGNSDLTVSAYDHVSAPWGSTHEESIKPLLKYAHVSGMYIWTGFDYIGEPTPYPWPARSSYFGIIDLAGFPKDVYYLYQSVFTDKPVLHIYPHWNWKQGDTVDVVGYYNNADEVELFLNGKSLGKQTKQGDELHVKWRVPFAAGTLKAVSTKNGKVVLKTETKTASDPYRLIIKADRSSINADGKELSFIEVNIVDKNGVPVPYAKNLVKFSVSGQGFIAGVDSGDPVSMESFKSNQHTALNGKVLCIIQSNGKKGSISLTASADGLQSSTIQITTK